MTNAEELASFLDLCDAPPPPPGATCDTGEDYETVSSRMAAVCCPKDAEHDCSPVPPACLEDCAPEFTSFYVSCGSVRSLLMQHLRPCGSLSS